MVNETSPLPDLSNAAAVRCIGVLEFSIMAFIIFLAADRDGLLCKIPVYEWRPECGVLLPLSSGVCQKIREIGILSLLAWTNFDQDPSVRAYEIMETVDWSRIGPDDPFLNFEWESGAMFNHMPPERRARSGGLYVFADRRKDEFSVGDVVISGDAGFFALGDWEAAQVYARKKRKEFPSAVV